MSSGIQNRGGRHIPADIRAAYLRALKGLADDGKPLHDIIRMELLRDPLGALTVLSKFVPKELMIEATITDQIDEMSDEDLDKEISSLIRETAPNMRDVLTAVAEKKSKKDLN